jgi:hypothetical protein
MSAGEEVAQELVGHEHKLILRDLICGSLSGAIGIYLT